MQHTITRRNFLALASASAAALAASPALAEDAPATVASDEDVLAELPEEPTYDDFVTLADEHPEVLPPDPGPMGQDVDADDFGWL